MLFDKMLEELSDSECISLFIGDFFRGDFRHEHGAFWEYDPDQKRFLIEVERGNLSWRVPVSSETEIRYDEGCECYDFVADGLEFSLMPDGRIVDD